MELEGRESKTSIGSSQFHDKQPGNMQRPQDAQLLTWAEPAAFGHGSRRAVGSVLLRGVKGRLSEVRGVLTLDGAGCGSEHRKLRRQQGVRVGCGGSRRALLSGGRPPLSPVFTTFSMFPCFFQTKLHGSKLEIRIASCSDWSLVNQLY